MKKPAAQTQTDQPAATTAQTGRDKQCGLRCPKCGCEHFYVIYTRRAWGNILRRRRECRHCGRRVTTTERIHG